MTAVAVVVVVVVVVVARPVVAEEQGRVDGLPEALVGVSSVAAVATAALAAQGGEGPWAAVGERRPAQDTLPRVKRTAHSVRCR